MLGDYVALKLMKANFATSLALILAMAACGSAPSGRDAEAGKQSSFKPMNGYRDLELGMSFEAAIGKLDSDLFNPASLKECFDDLALRGCGLMRKSTESMYEMRSGIPYALRLNFNSDDKLTDIELNYRRESRIGRAVPPHIWADCRLGSGRLWASHFQAYRSKNRDIW